MKKPRKTTNHAFVRRSFLKDRLFHFIAGGLLDGGGACGGGGRDEIQKKKAASAEAPARVAKSFIALLALIGLTAGEAFAANKSGEGGKANQNENVSAEWIESLESASWQSRQKAVKNWGAVPDLDPKKALFHLDRRLSDRSQKVREAAISALQEAAEQFNGLAAGVAVSLSKPQKDDSESLTLKKLKALDEIFKNIDFADSEDGKAARSSLLALCGRFFERDIALLHSHPSIFATVMQLLETGMGGLRDIEETEQYLQKTEEWKNSYSDSFRRQGRDPTVFWPDFVNEGLHKALESLPSKHEKRASFRLENGKHHPYFRNGRELMSDLFGDLLETDSAFRFEMISRVEAVKKRLEEKEEAGGIRILPSAAAEKALQGLSVGSLTDILALLDIIPSLSFALIEPAAEKRLSRRLPPKIRQRALMDLKGLQEVYPSLYPEMTGFLEERLKRESSHSMKTAFKKALKAGEGKGGKAAAPAAAADSSGDCRGSYQKNPFSESAAL